MKIYIGFFCPKESIFICRRRVACESINMCLLFLLLAEVCVVPVNGDDVCFPGLVLFNNT